MSLVSGGVTLKLKPCIQALEGPSESADSAWATFSTRITPRSPHPDAGLFSGRRMGGGGGSRVTAHTFPRLRTFPSFAATLSVRLRFLISGGGGKKARFYRMWAPSAPLLLDTFGLSRDRRDTSYVLLSSVIGQSRPMILPSAGRSETHAWATPPNLLPYLYVCIEA